MKERWSNLVFGKPCTSTNERKEVKRMKRRVFALLLVAAMVFGLAGSAFAKTEAADYINMESQWPVVNEPIELTVTVLRPGGNYGSDTEQKWFWQYSEEMSGIDFKVTQIDDTAWAEKKPLIFASGDMTDVYFKTSFTRAEILKYGQVDKLFIPLNDLFATYAPNILKCQEQWPVETSQMVCPDGNIYGFGTYYEYIDPGTRVWIHQSWLDALGLSMPSTLDDFYNTLVAFRDNDPNGNGEQDEVPWLQSFKDADYSWRTLLFNANGIVSNGSVLTMGMRDGAPVLPELEPEYKDAIEYMRKLYAEGLVDQDCYSMTQQDYQAKAATNVAGMAFEGAPFLIVPLDMGDIFEEYKAMNPLVAKDGDTRIWPMPGTYDFPRATITSACKYPEAAVRWLDFMYDRKNALLCWAGPPKGSEYDIHPEYGIGWIINENNDMVRDPYPEGCVNEGEAIGQYVIEMTGWNPGIVNANADWLEFFGEERKWSKYENAWRSSYEEALEPYHTERFPDLFYDQTQLDQLTDVRTPLETFIKSMEAKFITGAADISEWDKYIEDMKAMGIENYMKIYQDAYTAYTAK